MEEQLVSFETAKLAKEKNFNWETTHFYTIDGMAISIDHKYSTFSCIAPTQSLLQKWLREKHEIEAFVKPFTIPQLNRRGSIKYYGLVMMVDCIGDCNTSTECKDIYEDAFEEALLLALNLITL
jgi:hypothetical protein